MHEYFAINRTDPVTHESFSGFSKQAWLKYTAALSPLMPLSPMSWPNPSQRTPNPTVLHATL